VAGLVLVFRDFRVIDTFRTPGRIVQMKKHLKRRVFQYAAVFEPDDESGGYTVYIPALPGCISEGNTFEEALKNIQEAASLYLEVARERKEKPASTGEGMFVAPVRVSL